MTVTVGPTGKKPKRPPRAHASGDTSRSQCARTPAGLASDGAPTCTQSGRHVDASLRERTRLLVAAKPFPASAGKGRDDRFWIGARLIAPARVRASACPLRRRRWCSAGHFRAPRGRSSHSVHGVHDRLCVTTIPRATAALARPDKHSRVWPRRGALEGANHGPRPPATGKKRRATGKTATAESQGHGGRRARPARGAPPGTHRDTITPPTLQWLGTELY